MQQVYQVVSETWVDGGWVHVKFTDSSSIPTGTRIIDKDGNDCTQISCMESTGNGFAGQFTILIPQESMDEGDGSVQVEVRSSWTAGGTTAPSWWRSRLHTCCSAPAYPVPHGDSRWLFGRYNS